jgi:hypothetical protein
MTGSLKESIYWIGSHAILLTIYTTIVCFMAAFYISGFEIYIFIFANLFLVNYTFFFWRRLEIEEINLLIARHQQNTIKSPLIISYGSVKDFVKSLSFNNGKNLDFNEVYCLTTH